MTMEEFERKMDLMAERQSALVEADARLGNRITESEKWLTARIAESDARIADSEARFTRKMDGLMDLQAKADSRIGRLEESFLVVVDLLRGMDQRLDDSAARAAETAARAAEAAVRTAEAAVRTAETEAILKSLAITIEELAQTEKKTSERLDIFIEVLERYIREGRNGKPRG